jgi:hypothetical protein
VGSPVKHSFCASLLIQVGFGFGEVRLGSRKTNGHQTRFRQAGKSRAGVDGMGVRQGVAMDSLKFYPGPICPTLLRPAGGPPLKRPNGHFRGDLPTGQAACGRFFSFWTSHTLGLCNPSVRSLAHKPQPHHR